MATIRKRGPNQWQVQVRIKGSPEQSRTFRSIRDASDWAKLVESRILRGLASLPEKRFALPLKHYLERYQKEISPLKKGVKQEISRLQLLRQEKISNLVIDQIRPSSIAEWRDKRLLEVGPATVVREMSVLSHVFSIAQKEWGLEGLQNPVQAIRKPKFQNGRQRRISSDEVEAILLTTRSNQLKAIFALALETGMRRSEICGLKWRNVDCLARTIYLPDSKNGKSRVIPMSKRAKTLLEGLSESKEGQIFSIRPDSVTQAFSRACERAKLPNLRFHDTRHEATTRLFEKGLSVMEAASITGHMDIRMLSRYTHINATSILNKLD